MSSSRFNCTGQTIENVDKNGTTTDSDTNKTIQSCEVQDLKTAELQNVNLVSYPLADTHRDEDGIVYIDRIPNSVRVNGEELEVVYTNVISGSGSSGCAYQNETLEDSQNDEEKQGLPTQPNIPIKSLEFSCDSTPHPAAPRHDNILVDSELECDRDPRDNDVAAVNVNVNEDNDSDNNFTSANNNSTVLSNLALLDTSQLENIVQTSVLASLNSLKSLAGSHVINLVVNVGCSNSYSRNESDNAVAGVAAAASNTKLHCKCKSKIKTSISVPVPASAKEDSTPSTCAVVNTSKQKNVVPTVSKSKCKRSSRLQKDKTPSVPRSAVGVLFNKVHSGIKNIPNVNNDGININHGHNSVEPNRYERRKRSRSPNNSSDSNSNDTEFQNYLQFSSSYLKPQTMRNVLGAGAEGELASCNGARKTVSEKSESSESESDDDDSGKPKDNTKVTETDLGLDLNPISNLDGPDGPRKKSIKLKKYSDLVKKYATKNKKIPMQIIRKQFDYTKQGFYLCKVEGCMCAVKHAQSLRRHWFTHVLQEEDDDMNSDSDISDDGLDSYTSVNTTHTKTKTTKTGLHSHNNSRDSYNYDLDLSFGSESDLDLDSDDSESYQSYQRAETESNERLKRRRAQGGLKKHLSQKKLILD